MKRIFLLSYILLFFVSCDLFTLKKQNINEERPIATVYNKHLYRKDVVDLLSKKMTKEDSIIIVKGLINTWAKKQLFLIKAEENISEINSLEIEKLVRDYKSSLYINHYKERLIKQKLDTVVSEPQVLAFYKKNKTNFRLNKELVQFEYIYLGKDHFEKKEIINSFKSSKKENKENLEKYLLSLKSYRLQDSSWVDLEFLRREIPVFATESKENLLKISKFIQKEDSLGVYLVSINNFLKKNSIAPLDNVKHRIKQIVLHKRKRELIREIEKTLINDAIQNKNFKEY